MSRSPSFADANEQPESCQRYTRSELLALRFASCEKPKCFSRYNVSYLGFWKKNPTNQQQLQVALNNNNSNSSGNLNDPTNYESSGGGGGGSGVSNNSQAISSRTLRNRERATNYYRRMKGDNEQGGGSGSNNCDQQTSSSSTSVAQNYSSSMQQQQQAPYIDHRSISSAHLMPAFAKRRFAALPANTNANEQQQPTANTPNELKDYNNTYDGRDGRGNNSHRLVKDTKTYNRQPADAVHSPHRKNASEQQQQHGDRHHGEQEHSRRSSSSPTHQLGSRHSNTNVNERRIGSGRLLPRDVGWDYRSPEQKETAESNNEKDPVPQNAAGLRTGGNTRNSRVGRFASDRSNERRGVGGDSYNERQPPFESRGGGGGASNNDAYQPYESKRNQYSIRRTNAKDSLAANDRYGGRNRHQHYNMRKEEPEWFSGGPTSQHETIELHGFFDAEGSESSDSSKPQKQCDSSSTHSSEEVRTMGEWMRLEDELDNRAKLLPVDLTGTGSECESDCDDTKTRAMEEINEIVSAAGLSDEEEEMLKKGKSGISKTAETSNADLILDAFFADSLDPSLMHTAANAGNQETTGGSRFSRWFANKDAQKQLDEKLEPRPDTAADKQGSQNISLMEFLQRGKLPPKTMVINTTPQFMPSVEELEARMRHLESSDTMQQRNVKSELKKDEQKMNVNEMHNNELPTPSNPQKYQTSLPMQMPTQDTDAFRKLLEQLGSQQTQTNNNVMQPTMPTPPNMLEAHPGVPAHPSFGIKNANLMLQQQQQQQQPTNLMQHGAVQPPNVAYDNLKEDEIKKLLQQQQQQHNEMLHNQQQQQQHQHQRHLVHQQHQQQQHPQHQKQVVSKSTPTPIPIPPYPHPTMQNAMLFNQTQNLPDPAMLPNILTRQEQKHIDVQFLRQLLARGRITVGSLEQELQNPNVNVLCKDVIATVLSERNALSLSCMGRNPIQQMPPHHQILNDTNQPPPPLLHHPILPSTAQQQDQRHSNARTPVQRTQSYEDMLVNQVASTGNQTVQGVQQQTRHSNSPTPLAFTPTSVLRKMTAEKDSSVAQGGVVCHQLQTPVQNQNKQGQTNFGNFQQQAVQPNPHPRMILGGNHVNQQQQQQLQLHASPTQISPQILGHQPQQLRNNSQQMKWSGNSSNVTSNKPMGRPILKGPVNAPITPNQQQVTPMAFASKLEMQQMHQQRLKHNQTPQQQAIIQQPPHPPPLVQPVPHPLQTHNNMITHIQQQQFFHQHHQRALAVQRQQQLQQQQQAAANLANSQLDASQNNTAGPGSNNQLGIMNYQRDGGLSPTSNQLAQWFSPELLAQASAGKLPLLNVNQALSLEEFERSIQHSSAAVHN